MSPDYSLTFLREHGSVTIEGLSLIRPILFKGEPQRFCIGVNSNSGGHVIEAGYFIGCDWLESEQRAVHIAPKLLGQDRPLDYMKMLTESLLANETADYTHDLYEIKFDEKPVWLTRQEDLLTPLLIVEFLQRLKKLVRKGLRYSYYAVERNLYARSKGKVLVGATIARNHMKNKQLNTWCRYEEFGPDSPENRLLKQALHAAKRYLLGVPTHESSWRDSAGAVIQFCTPAFTGVSDKSIETASLAGFEHNPFFHEYGPALRLAQLLLKRFGYSVAEASPLAGHREPVPPFWIDMSKLFELYVLGLLQRAYPGQIKYETEQAGGHYGLPDYLLVDNYGQRWIIDAKYRPHYQGAGATLVLSHIIDNIRQISGYARDKGVLKKLKYSAQEIDQALPNCLVIYPDQEALMQFDSDVNLMADPITAFNKFFKLGMRLPESTLSAG